MLKHVLFESYFLTHFTVKSPVLLEDVTDTKVETENLQGDWRISQCQKLRIYLTNRQIKPQNDQEWETGVC
jgi:hypothetical protein